jgi:hypothetical protein
MAMSGNGPSFSAEVSLPDQAKTWPVSRQAPIL